MDTKAASIVFAALGHPARLAVFRLLVRRAPGGVRPSEIAAALGLPRNTLSVYLATLTRAGLIRSERRGKALYYRLERAHVAGFVGYLVDDCCRGRPELCTPIRSVAARDSLMSPKPYEILFLCTGNAARSLMAEAIVNSEPSGRFRARSAGTRPAAAPNPAAIELLASHGHATAPLRPKDLAEVAASDGPEFDFVITLCDSAANEECPVWPGHPVTALWAIANPSAASGTPAEKALALQQIYGQLQRRLQVFMALPFASLDRLSLQQRVDAIGAMDLRAPNPIHAGREERISLR